MAQNGIVDAAKNFGEYSAHWAMSNIEALIGVLNLPKEEQYGLILTEDKMFLNANSPRNTHLLSTRAFLVALEDVGLIPDAENLRTAIKNSDRPGFAKSLIDKPYRSENSQTDYVGGLLDTVAAKIREKKKNDDKNESGKHSHPGVKL